MTSEGTWVPKSPDLSALLPADLDPTQNHLPQPSSAFHFQAQPPPLKLYTEPPPTPARSYYANNIYAQSPSYQRPQQFTSAPSPVRSTYIPPTTPRLQQFFHQPQGVNGHAHAHPHSNTITQTPTSAAYTAVPVTPYREEYKPPATYRQGSVDLGQYPPSPYSQKGQATPSSSTHHHHSAYQTPLPKASQALLNLHDNSAILSSPITATPISAAMPPRKSQMEEGSPAGVEPSPVKTKFPTARIKRIMQADEEVGKVAQQTPIAVGKALELFMIALVQESAAIAKDKGQKRVSAQMLKQVVEADDQWDFLREIVAKVENEEKSGRGKAKAETDSDEDSEPKKRGRGGRKKKAASDE